MSATLQRFLNFAREWDRDAGQIEEFERTILIAQSIALFSDPLDAGHDAIGAYIREHHAALDRGPEDPTDPNHECAKAAVTENACYYIGLAVGLMAADHVNGEAE